MMIKLHTTRCPVCDGWTTIDDGPCGVCQMESAA